MSHRAICLLAALLLLAIASPGAAQSSEQVVVTKCLARSLGQPALFAQCAFKDLSLYELKKCLSGRCLGRNSEIVKFTSWLNRTLLNNCGMQAIGTPKMHFAVLNNTRMPITYTIEPEIAGDARATILPGRMDTWTLDYCDRWVNIHGVGESFSYDAGGVMEFAPGTDGFIHQYVVAGR